jgi:hypothetical protein
MKEQSRDDGFLDPDRQHELRQWLNHPDEADDMMAASWSASRSNVIDPRRGPPDSAKEYESEARNTCAHLALEDTLVEQARLRARRIAITKTLQESGVIDSSTAKAAAKRASEQEELMRKQLIDSPPAAHR